MRTLVDIRRVFQNLVLTALALSSGFSQELRGTVIEKETKLPLPSANVYLHSTKYGTITDSLGQFAIRNLPVGSYVLEARLLGYKTGRYVLSANKDEVITLLIELEDQPIRLGEVVVSDSLRMKRLATQGKEIISSQEITRSGTSSLSVFLRNRYPRLFPVSPPPGIRRGAYPSLRFILYIDGTLVQYSSDIFDTMLDPEKVDYIEVYRSFGIAPTSSRGSYERVVHIHTKLPELQQKN